MSEPKRYFFFAAWPFVARSYTLRKWSSARRRSPIKKQCIIISLVETHIWLLLLTLADLEEALDEPCVLVDALLVVRALHELHELARVLRTVFRHKVRTLLCTAEVAQCLSGHRDEDINNALQVFVFVLLLVKLVDICSKRRGVMWYKFMALFATVGNIIVSYSYLGHPERTRFRSAIAQIACHILVYGTPATLIKVECLIEKH